MGVLTPQDVGVEYEWEEIVDLLNEWVEDEKVTQHTPFTQLQDKALI